MKIKWHVLLIPLVAAILLSSLSVFAQPEFPVFVRVLQTANLRSGPGVTFDRVDGAEVDDVLTAVGCNEACDWYELAGGEWIAAFLVEPLIGPIDLPTPGITTTVGVTTTGVSTETTGVTVGGFVTLLVAGWNIESGLADPEMVGQRVAELDNVDLWGVSEVLNANVAATMQEAAADGGEANFESILSQSGGSDRLAIVYNADRFELMEQEELTAINIGGALRAPLLVRLFDRLSGQELLFMVNHLDRTNSERRHEQATMLNQWVSTQTLPIIAVGDYSFDWQVVDGDQAHDPGYDNMTADGLWQWVRPDTLVRTQCAKLQFADDTPTDEVSCRFDTVLDFVFSAGAAQSWTAASEIMVTEGDLPDTNDTPDHRPVLGWFQLPVIATELPTPATSTVTTTAIVTTEVATTPTVTTPITATDIVTTVTPTPQPTSSSLLPTPTPRLRTPSAITTTPVVTATALLSTSVNGNANFRGGPDTSYPVIGNAPLGTWVTVVGQTIAGDWYLLDTGAWVAAFLVDNAPANLPIATPPPASAVITPTVTPTPEAPADFPLIPTPVPTAPTTAEGAAEADFTCDPSYPDVCIPSAPPILSCADVAFRAFSVVGADPHDFDPDGNGIGCESDVSNNG